MLDFPWQCPDEYPACRYATHVARSGCILAWLQPSLDQVEPRARDWRHDHGGDVLCGDVVDCMTRQAVVDKR